MVRSRRSRRAVFPKLGLGFTFLEVLVVLAIIAILSAIAYPSYIQYITRANRAAAQGFVLEAANRQERYLLDRRSYAANIGTLGVSVPNNVAQNYTIATVVPSVRALAPPTSYDVSATPTGSQASRDAACGILTIDETGAKTVSGSAGPTSCWRQ